jgi:hypothetical protein
MAKGIDTISSTNGARAYTGFQMLSSTLEEPQPTNMVGDIRVRDVVKCGEGGDVGRIWRLEDGKIAGTPRSANNVYVDKDPSSSPPGCPIAQMSYIRFENPSLFSRVRSFAH